MPDHLDDHKQPKHYCSAALYLDDANRASHARLLAAAVVRWYRCCGALRTAVLPPAAAGSLRAPQVILVVYLYLVEA